MATEEIIAKAKEKVDREINEYEDLKREAGMAIIMAEDDRNPFKEFLFNRIDTVDGFAEKVLQEDKSISKGLVYCGNHIPDKIKKMKMVHPTSNQVYTMFCDYFDWDEKAENAKKEAERQKKLAKAAANAKTEPFDHEKYRKEQEEKRKAEEAKRKEEEERKKREKLGICEGQLDIFGLCGMAESTKVEEEKPKEVSSQPITVIRPVVHAENNDSSEEEPVIEAEATVEPEKQPFSLELKPLEESVPEPQNEEPKQEKELTEDEIYELLGF